MDGKITLFLHDEIHDAIRRHASGAELEALYAEAFWNVFVKRPFGDVINRSFSYFSRTVPVRFTPQTAPYLKWCGLSKKDRDSVIDAFNDEVYNLLVEYECGLRGDKT